MISMMWRIHGGFWCFTTMLITFKVRFDGIAICLWYQLACKYLIIIQRVLFPCVLPLHRVVFFCCFCFGLLENIINNYESLYQWFSFGTSIQCDGIILSKIITQSFVSAFTWINCINFAHMRWGVSCCAIHVTNDVR